MESTFIQKATFREFQGTDTEYHADKDYMSASSLKRLKVSPLHYKEEEEQKETDALIFGSAYHCFILEPEKFKEQYFVFDDTEIYEQLIGEGSKSPRSTNKYKEWASEQMSKIGDKQTIDKATHLKLIAMRERLMSHHNVRTLLSDGVNEQGFFGEFETESGIIKVKIKPDHYNDKKRIVVDLKTTIDASADGFARKAADMNYHIQAALYSDVMELIEGENRLWSFFFIAQEKSAPYAFNIFEASPQFISQGRYEYEQLLKLWKYCNDNDKFPGYQVWNPSKYGVLDLSLPPWSIKELTFYTHK